MQEHSSNEPLERESHFKTTEDNEEKFFVIDINKYRQEIDAAMLSLGDNSESDSILTSLASEKIKSAPASLKKATSSLKKLRAASPNMAGYIDTVSAQLSVYSKFSINKPLKLAPTLLVGPPGTGKTYIATKVAEAISIWHANISLSLATESFVLTGCPKGYSTANPGDIARRMAKSDCINPLIILDELDKACFEPLGRPSITGPLLQILESDTAAQFEDACLKCELNLSHVSWLATANDTIQIPEPILSRFHIIYIKDTDHESKAMQVQRVAFSVIEDMGLGEHITASVAQDALEKYNHLSIRDWKIKLYLAISLKASNSNKGDSIVICAEDMKELVNEKKKSQIGFL